MSGPNKEPRYEPRAAAGATACIYTSAKTLKRMRRLARELNVRRPSGAPSCGALMDAIARGDVVVMRREDVPVRPVAGDPRCPGDWAD